jgi:hypothetical protein
LLNLKNGSGAGDERDKPEAKMALPATAQLERHQLWKPISIHCLSMDMSKGLPKSSQFHEKIFDKMPKASPLSQWFWHRLQTALRY